MLSLLVFHPDMEIPEDIAARLAKLRDRAAAEGRFRVTAMIDRVLGGANGNH